MAAYLILKLNIMNDILHILNSRIYWRIEKNIFSIGRNGILKTLGILCLPQKIKKIPE